MIEEQNLIYTDGHDVKVTSDRFIIRNSTYFINGITRAKMLIVRANKWLPVLLVVIGIGLLILGFYHILFPMTEQNLAVADTNLTTERIIEIVGCILLFVGVIWLAAAHDKYIVRITTAEGDKDVIKSTRRDYVDQILSALNRATIPVV